MNMCDASPILLPEICIHNEHVPPTLLPQMAIGYKNKQSFTIFFFFKQVI